MKQWKIAAIAAATVLATLGSTGAMAAEQYMPVLSYRTGPYAPNGVPIADGIVDYMKLVNERGGINGVKLLIEECETAYDTARSVECYERTKAKNGGAVAIQPWSTGATFALTEKAPIDKISLVTLGYGRSESADGSVFKWNFPLAGNYWVGADVIIQAIGKREGGMDKLKGKKIALIYHDSPYGKESIPMVRERAKMLGFSVMELPVAHPGVEQKATWLQIRKERPDYVIMWGFGVMNSTALKEAQATGYPRDKMYGSWWAGAEPDTRDAGEAAKGYNAVALQNSADKNAAVVKETLGKLYAQGKGTASTKDEVGSVLWLRGAMSSMVVVEGIRRAQERFGKGKVMNGEQVRWGLENLNLTAERIKEIGFENVIRPLATNCQDHMGSYWARIETWDGKEWKISSDWMQGDEQIIKPMIKAAAAKYAQEQKITPRTGTDCDS